ncbi:MAG TPA: TRAP transporter large permease subunit, partial [Paenalcaligenes sp.]|nr:TRAP transporter large permease subunit [Paenalcaligenes sp.]
MLLIMLLVPFVLFMFLDQISLLMVLIPIYQPILNVYEFDSIWFWTLVLVITTLGGISPPFGYTLFAFKSAAKEMSLNDVFRAAWPFVGIIICGIVLLIAFPEVVLFLPELSIGAE